MGLHGDDDTDGVINRNDPDWPGYLDPGLLELDDTTGDVVPHQRAVDAGVLHTGLGSTWAVSDLTIDEARDDVERRARVALAAPRLGAGASFTVDVHPKFQAGLNIEQVAREGIVGVAVKVSQGTSGYSGSADWLARAERAGAVAVPYHYLNAGNEVAQARFHRTVTGGRPSMLDVEKGSGNRANVDAFLAECRRIGQRVALTYWPNWYWVEVGRPSLAGLPPLVASHYVSGSGPASSLYRGVPDSWWAGYGGNTPALLQFTDKAQVAGQRIDANAYRGTRDQLAALVHGGPVTAPPDSGELMQDKYSLFGADVDVWDVASGSAARDGRWIYLTVTLFAGRVTGWVDLQDDHEGVGQRQTFDLAVGPDNLSPRWVLAVPSGATKARVGWDATRAQKASLTVTGGK